MNKKIIFTIILCLFGQSQAKTNWESCHYSDNNEYHCHNNSNKKSESILVSYDDTTSSNTTNSTSSISNHTSQISSTVNNEDSALFFGSNEESKIHEKNILEITNINKYPKFSTDRKSVKKKIKFYARTYKNFSKEIKKLLKTNKKSLLVVFAYKKSEKIIQKACSHKEKSVLFQIKKETLPYIMKLKKKHAYKVPKKFETAMKNHCKY